MCLKPEGISNSNLRAITLLYVWTVEELNLVKNFDQKAVKQLA